MRRVALELVYLFCISNGLRMQELNARIREGEGSYAPKAFTDNNRTKGLTQMAHSLVEREQRQADKVEGMPNPFRALAVLLLAGTRPSAGLQFSTHPAGRPLGIQKHMGPMNPSGGTSRILSTRHTAMQSLQHWNSSSRRPTSVIMQSDSDDKRGAEMTDALGDESPAVQGTGANKQNNEPLEVDEAGNRVEFDKEFYKIVDSLKADAPRIFRREPNWDIFAEDFKLIETSGDVVQGLGPIKMTLALLRKMRNRVAITEDVDVEFTQHPISFNGDFSVNAPLQKTVLTARWKVKLGLELPNAPGDSVIEAESTFHFNDDNKVDYIQMDKWVVTGELLQPLQPLKSWPEVKLSDDRAVFLQQLKDWETDLKEMNEAFPAGAGPEAAETLVKAASDLAATFISSELQYLATISLRAGLLGGASDAISQAIDGGIAAFDGVAFDGSHVGAMALSAGVLSGLFDALWLQELEREFPGNDNAAVLTKTVADFAIAGTLFNSLYLVSVPFLAATFDGAPPGTEHLLDGWTLEKFASAMRLELFTFTPYDLFAFRIIPPKFRPFAAAVVSALYTIILSGITRAGIIGS